MIDAKHALEVLPTVRRVNQTLIEKRTDPTTVFVSHITSTTELMCAKFAVTNVKPVRRALTIVFLAKVPKEGQQRLRVYVCRSSSTMESTQIARRVCTTAGHAPMAPPVPRATIRRDAP